MINLFSIAKLSLPNHIRKALECCMNSCSCFDMNNPCIASLCDKDKCTVQRFIDRWCNHGKCNCTWLTAPFPLPDAWGTMPNWVTYTVTNPWGTTTVFGNGGAIEWSLNTLLTITFSQPTDIIVSHIDDLTGLNPLIWAWHNVWGFNTEIISDASSVIYTPWVQDLTNDVSIVSGNVINTWSPVYLATDDWGEFLFTNVTSMTVQASSTESMQFVAVP